MKSLFGVLCTLLLCASVGAQSHTYVTVPYAGNNSAATTAWTSSSGSYPAGAIVSRNGQLCVSLKFNNAGDPATDTTDWACSAAPLGFTPENTANKGQPNGYASLDSTGKVPSANLPSAVSSSAAAGSQGSVQIAGAGSSPALAASFPYQEFGRVPKPEMYTWQHDFHNCANQVVYGYAFTDSTGVVYASDGSGEGPAQASQRYQDLFVNSMLNSCAWNGTGVVPFLKFLIPGSPNPNAQYYTAVSGTWNYDTSGLGPIQTNPSNNSVWTPVMVANQGMTFTWTTSGTGQMVDTVRAVCKTGSGYGTWNVTLQGVANNAVTGTVGTFTCGGNGASAWTETASSSFTATQVNAVFTCSATPCVFYGAEGSKGSVGIEWNNLGAASGAASLWASSNAYGLLDILPAGSLYLTDFGTNDPALGFTTSQFTSNLEAIANHVKAYTTAPSVLFTFPPVSNNGVSSATYQNFAQAGLVAANAVGAGWANNEDFWGTTFLPGNFGSDGVHPNAIGSYLKYLTIWGSVMDSTVPLTSASGAAQSNGTSPTLNIANGAFTVDSSGTVVTKSSFQSAYILGTGTIHPTGTCNTSALLYMSTYGGGTYSLCNNGSWTDLVTTASLPKSTAIAYGTPSMGASTPAASGLAGSPWPNTDHLFTVLYQGPSVAAGGLLAQINFGKRWKSADGSSDELPVCQFSMVNSGSITQVSYAPAANYIDIYTTQALTMASGSTLAIAANCNADNEQ